MMSDFWGGFLVGFLAAGLFGLALQQFRLWRKKWRAMTEPQKVELKTSKTPWQVVSGGFQVGCLVIVIILSIGLILWALLESPW
jgi:high-affinity Fe2+/Pb2+ permease